jgi:type II secretory ATPase GspE/PulE/Tfp pilus assembly ATPase PilB-like protein
MPVAQGEKIVLRLLNEAVKNSTLEQLGLPEELIKILQKKTAKIHGLILCVSLAGGGKTATLYSLLNLLNRPELNISTIEEDISYRLPGVNQGRISPELDFTLSRGLASLLNQDPDIIMIDEIRDKATAQLATQAALGGQLILAALTAADAGASLKRLLSLELSPAAITESVSLIVAQKLVKKNCPHCSASVEPDKQTLTAIKKRFDLESAEGLKFYQGKGCKQCSNTGYLGRTAVFEFLEITPAITKLILSGADLEKIKSAALDEGMCTLDQDGLTKALNGIISLEEILN